MSPSIAGAIRFVGGIFQGFDGTRWVPLSKSVDTQYYAISPAAFVSENNGSGWYIQGGGAALLSGTAYLSAPINLPHKVKVTSITFNYVDNSTNDLEMSLYTPSNSGIFLIDSYITSGASTGIKTKTILTDFATDNSVYSMHVEVRPKAGDVWDGNAFVYNIILTYLCE